MKAIISRPDSSGRPQVFGYGTTESAARVVAYAFLHNGHNDFEQEYQGGYCVTIAAPLARFILYDEDSADGIRTYDQDGTLVAVECADAELRLRSAMMHLKINDRGELTTEYLSGCQ